MTPLGRAVLVAALLAMVWSGPTPQVTTRAAMPAATTRALYAVAARAGDEVWAVGITGYPAPFFTLVEHWDGTRWRDVSPRLSCTPEMAADPNLGSTYCAQASTLGLSTNLWGVAALSSQDVWAVGSNLGLVLHWDGTRWRVAWWNRSWVTHPQAVVGVAAVSARDVWVVGSEGPSGDPPRLHSLAMHWDGVRWRTVPAPGAGLSRVVALSSRDVWAVGSTDPGGLIAHWDGVRWQVVYASGEQVACCTAIAAVSPHEVWVAGASSTPVTAVQHWDGVRWRSVPLATVPGGFTLMDMAGTAPHDVWVVEAATAKTAKPTSQTLIEHWDGVRWRMVPSPTVAGRDSILWDLAAVSARDVWAVGASTQHKAGGCGGGPCPTQTLIEHWDGVRWSIVPS